MSYIDYPDHLPEVSPGYSVAVECMLRHPIGCQCQWDHWRPNTRNQKTKSDALHERDVAMYNRGLEDGRAEVRAQLRTLLGTVA